MSKEIKFTCPVCGKEKIEEILINVIQTSVINAIFECGDFDYGSILAEDGEIDRFQCAECGYTIIDENDEKITDQMELVEYLKNKK